MATVILSIAASGVLLPFASGASVRAEGMHRTLGAKLASDLIEEIVTTPFDQIVPNYNYSESQGQVKDAAGVIFTDSNYAKFGRDVSCSEVNVSQESGNSEIKFILVTVQVSYDGNQIVLVNRLISR